MNQKVIVTIISLLFIILLAITLILGFYEFNWFGKPKNTYTTANTPMNTENLYVYDNSTDYNYSLLSDNSQDNTKWARLNNQNKTPMIINKIDTSNKTDQSRNLQNTIQEYRNNAGNQNSLNLEKQKNVKQQNQKNQEVMIGSQKNRDVYTVQKTDRSYNTALVSERSKNINSFNQKSSTSNTNIQIDSENKSFTAQKSSNGESTKKVNKSQPSQNDSRQSFQYSQQSSQYSKTSPPQKNKNVTQNTKKSSENSKYTQKPENVYYAKGSDLPEQNFHSYGEYITPEEHQYRLSLINHLKIKTIIVDRLTKGNGISQEYFKIAYANRMIPAKILAELVESKEFRKLIPQEHLNDEIKITGLPKGKGVVFRNDQIKDLLILWSLGRLSPIQKAWKTKADK